MSEPREIPAVRLPGGVVMCADQWDSSWRVLVTRGDRTLLDLPVRWESEAQDVLDAFEVVSRAATEPESVGRWSRKVCGTWFWDCNCPGSPDLKIENTDLCGKCGARRPAEMPA